MRRRPILVVVVSALACVGALSLRAAEKPTRKLSSAEREARGFLETVTGLVQPLNTVANQAAWIAATDVSPEHTAARAAAEKAAAAATGCKLVIARTGAFLAKPSELSDLSLRQLRKLQLAAAENPGTIPEVVSQRIEAEARQSAVLDSYSFCLQPLAGGSAAASPRPMRSIRSCARRACWPIANAPGWLPRRSAVRSSLAWSSCKPCATRSRAPWAIHRSSACTWPTTA